MGETGVGHEIAEQCRDDPDDDRPAEIGARLQRQPDPTQQGRGDPEDGGEEQGVADSSMLNSGENFGYGTEKP